MQRATDDYPGKSADRSAAATHTASAVDSRDGHIESEDDTRSADAEGGDESHVPQPENGGPGRQAKSRWKNIRAQLQNYGNVEWRCEERCGKFALGLDQEGGNGN